MSTQTALSNTLTTQNTEHRSQPLQYINEDLTGPTADQFRRAREMVKQKRLHKCWTYGGVVFVKKINEQSSQPVKLSLSTDLTSL